MGVLIGVLILVLLIAGLVSRKRSTKAWVKEERFEESGNWLDKRPGERGTWGSLDEEMSQERGQIVRQGRVVEMAEIIRQYAVETSPVFSGLSAEKLPAFRSHTRHQATQLVNTVEKISKGQLPPVVPADTPLLHSTLQKKTLDFAYQVYPGLLDLDIETIRQFDQYIGFWAATTMTGLEKWSTQ